MAPWKQEGPGESELTTAEDRKEYGIREEGSGLTALGQGIACPVPQHS